MKKNNVITLITDFGDEAGYAGVMKGVILNINPNCQVIDITHHVSPQDIEEAAFLLHNVYSYFPDHSIHIVVVDPGVGSERRPILVETDRYWFVGPDNGVFSFVFSEKGFKKVWEITNKHYFLPDLSFTFHGRDIFAPIAAHLSLGVSTREMGEEQRRFIMLKNLEPEISEGMIKARVVYIDRFGNLVSNLSKDLFTKLAVGKCFTIAVGGKVIRNLSLTYADAKEGEAFALFGSSGWLEISVKNGNCQRELNVKKGTEIDIYFS